MKTLLAKLVAVTLIGVAFIGCGGGGGGSSSTRLIYQTDWTNRGRAVTGLSQRVSLLDLEGRLLQTKIVNQEADGVQQVTFSSLSNGTYRLHIELFSQADLNGVVTGEIDAILTISGQTSFSTAVGDEPSSVSVTPAQATVVAGESAQFYANLKNASNIAVFGDPDDFTWQALGGIATVNDDGLVQTTATGMGSVRATHGATGFTGAATLDVEPFSATTSKWTVMVFINAANDLFTFSDLNVNQMEAVAQNPDVRFVVQWKQTQELYPSSSFDGTRRYLIKPDLTNDIASQLVQDLGDDVDMGLPSTMLDFINWAKTRYPADRYALVIWNHGSGWTPNKSIVTSRAVGFDDETGNAIEIPQLPQAIGSNFFDIIAFDASLMQMMEVAYEIQDQAELVVGSEESPPGPGYPYDLIFEEFRDNPDSSTATLSKAFVDGMLAVPSYQTQRITQSVLDSSKMSALGVAVDGLAAELIANVGSLGTIAPTVRANTQSYKPTSTRYFRDLYDLCLNLEASAAPASIKTKAAAVRTAIDDAVVWEGHNSNSPDSHGIAVDFSPSSTFTTWSADYALLRFASETQWDEWLKIAP